MRAKDFRESPCASGGHLTIATREKEKLLLSLELAFQGTKVASRGLAVLGEAGAVRPASLGATLPLTSGQN